jgi:signal transduction histidine kinase
MDESQKQLLDALTSKDELVGSIAHDLKGLLSGIEGGMYLVQSGLKKGKQERLDQGFDMVKRNVYRIRKTVSSILYYVKKRDFDWQEVRADALLESVDKLLSDRAASLGVDLQLTADDSAFEADEFATHSLLANIVDYALEACHNAKIKPAPGVKVSSKPGDASMILEVLADGFVIDDETRKIVFEPHYAPRGVDRSHLGLFIARNLIELHGGSLSITPAPGQETTLFSVAMPLFKPFNLADEEDEKTEDMLEKEWNR